VLRRHLWLVLCAVLASSCAPEQAADEPRSVGVKTSALYELVQSKVASTSLTNQITVTYDAQPTVGNLLVAIENHPSATTVLVGPSGWSVAANNANVSQGQIVFYKVAGAAEPTAVTVVDNTNLVHTLRILEFNSFDGKNAPVVASTRTASGGGTTFTHNSVTTTGSNALLIAASSNLGLLANPAVTNQTNSFVNLPAAVVALRTDSFTTAWRIADTAGSYNTATTFNVNALTVTGHLIAFNRMPIAVPYFIANAGVQQNVLRWGALDSPVSHVLILVKTSDCSFSATPVGTEARGAAVGNATVLFNDSPTASLSTNVMVESVSTTVSYTGSSNTLTHGALTAGVPYCYRIYVRNGAALDPEVSSPKTRLSTPYASSATAPRFIVSSGSATLASASIIPGVGAFYADTSGKVLIISNAGVPSYASFQLPDAVPSRGPAGIMTGDTESTLFLSAQSGDAYALWASGVSVGTLRWSTVAIDGDGSVAGDQTLGAALYAAPLVSKTHNRAFIATRNAAASRNRVFAVNATTGACVWVLNGTCVGATSSLDIGQISSVPVYDPTNFRMLFSSAQLNSGDTLYAVDSKDVPTSGRVLWSRSIGGSDSSLTYTTNNRDTVMVGTNAGRVYKLDAATGSTCWGSTTDGCGSATGSEQFFCASTSVDARATSCASGSAIQKNIVPVNGLFLGNVVFSTADGNVRMIHVNGPQAWRTQVAGASPPLPIPEVGTGKVYVGGSDGLVHELSLVNGVETGTRSVGGGSVIAGAPAYDSSVSPATLHVNTSTGYQYAFTVPF
jgi:hypothetical protein